MTKADLFTFITKHKLGVPGSLSASGLPQSALVGTAATKELEIVFDTVDGSRKYRNLIGTSFDALLLQPSFTHSTHQL